MKKKVAVYVVSHGQIVLLMCPLRLYSARFLQVCTNRQEMSTAGLSAESLSPVASKPLIASIIIVVVSEC